MARTNGLKGLFAAFYVKDMNSLAFKALSQVSQLAIFKLDKFYWESDRRNPIPLSQKWLGSYLECDPKTAQKVLTELDDYGFISRTQAGKLRGPRDTRSACYKLNWQPDNSGNGPSREWRKQSKMLINRKTQTG